MKIGDIILIIMFIISIFVGLWYLFGDSPTLEQALLLFILGSIVAIGMKGSYNNAKLEFIEKKMNKLDLIETKFSNIEQSMIRLAKDFKEHIKHK